MNKIIEMRYCSFAILCMVGLSDHIDGIEKSSITNKLLDLMNLSTLLRAKTLAIFR